MQKQFYIICIFKQKISMGGGYFNLALKINVDHFREPSLSKTCIGTYP